MENLLAARARTARSSVIRDLLRLVEQPGILSLAGGLPAARCFPVERLAAAADRALAACSPTAAVALQYGPTEGDGELRSLVASRLGCDTSQVLVTAGSQQALDLLARVIVDPGDVVVVEQPGYVGAIQALRAVGPELVGIPVDADGLRTDELEAVLRTGLRPKLVYTVANFQNPTGAVLSLERRVHLARLADAYGFLVVEDDPYGELRFGGDALPGVRTFGTNVVTLGTTSKTLAPGLRVGWAIAPTELIGPMVRLKQAADLHTSSLSQRIVVDVLADEPFLAGHLARVREVYREQADALIEALPPSLATSPCRGGLFVWATTSPTIDTGRLLEIAVDRGVAFVPGAAFGLDDAPQPTLRLSFATLSPDDLRAAADRLGRAVEVATPTDVVVG